MEKELFKNRFVVVSLRKDDGIVICKAISSFIPRNEFQEIFEKIGEYIKTNLAVNSLIFDKSSLSVFDQNAMTWYHVVWKVEMARYGLRTHRKILPKADFFKKSVQIGRGRIQKENPDFDFSLYDIQYSESLEQAIADCKAKHETKN